MTDETLYDDIVLICDVPERMFREEKLEQLVKNAILLIDNHVFEIDGKKMYSKRQQLWRQTAIEVLEAK